MKRKVEGKCLREVLTVDLRGCRINICTYGGEECWKDEKLRTHLSGILVSGEVYLI